MARLALRFALAAALVAVLLGGSVAQSDDPAPTPAHLIVHKVRTARDGARAEPRASTEPAAVLIASPIASRAPASRLDTVPGDGSIARPSSIRARSAAGRARHAISFGDPISIAIETPHPFPASLPSLARSPPSSPPPLSPFPAHALTQPHPSPFTPPRRRRSNQIDQSVAEPRLVVGRNMTIKISVHNAGETAATDVRVADPGWESEHFDVLGPATSATFAAVAPGATELLEFVVVPKVDGRFSAGPSLATYDAGAGASGGARSGVSNALPAIPILSEFERTVAEALEVGEKLTFGVYKTIEDWTRGATVFAGICVLFFGNWLALRGKKAVSAARSARAMEELLKMDEKKKE